MPSLANKHVVVGVSGGIAAYKSPDLVRRLRDNGAEVRVVMTENAHAFITPLTMQAVSGRPVHRELLSAEAESGMGHIELARWADAVLVAPASAGFLARLTHGFADDLLTTVCLATEAPLAVAPAMNQQMWQNAATQANLATLRERGLHIFGPDSGSQACGEVGPGRMLEPAELVVRLDALFSTGALDGLKVLITAGPTWEAIDPVRGITNLSSGKMGYAIAQAATEAGADVVLVSGPTALAAPPAVRTLRVTSALQMLDAVLAELPQTRIFIAVAAVADYRPGAPRDSKIKKTADTMTLDLVRNPDILATVAERHDRPFTVGFAAETDNVVEHAREKLLAKGVDMIAANRVGEPGTGFGSDDNALILIDRASTTTLSTMPKARLARALIREVAQRYHAKDSGQDTRQARR